MKTTEDAAAETKRRRVELLTSLSPLLCVQILFRAEAITFTIHCE